MAELSTIARPYAEALFEVAQAGDLNAWADLVGGMAAVAGHPDMKSLMADPKVSGAQVYDLFSSALKTSLDAQAQNFVRTLIDNGRLALLPEIARQFVALKNAREGTAEVHIVSAYALNDAQVGELVSGLEKKFQIKLKPQVAVDPGLIGGVRVSVGDQVLDTSVRAQLERMRHALAA